MRLRIENNGKNEVIVGVGAARAFAGLDVGRQIKVGQNVWDVVGVFTADGGVSESEIWTDTAVLQPAYNRSDSFQSVYAKLTSAGAFQQFKDTLITDPKLKVKVQRQSEFYEEQSTMVTQFITTIGVFIARLRLVRRAQHDVQRGGRRNPRNLHPARPRLRLVAGGFFVLTESVMLSILGALLGAGAAYLLFDGYRASTINWQTFSQVTFAFNVSPVLLAEAIVFATAIGLLGGLFPAIRAARLPIAAGLRES